MNLNFRLHRPEDLTAISLMWQQNTDWGDDAETIIQKYVVESCLEGACILLAIDESTEMLVGQFAFLPYLVQVGEKVVRGYRPVAPIVSKDFRYFKANPLEHPAIQMYMEGARLMQERGDGLIFMVPNPSWLRLLRMFPNLRTGSFPHFTRPLDQEALPELPADTHFGPIDPADTRIEDLWQRFRTLHGCSVVRDTQMLPWKIGKGEHEVLGVELAGRLVGLLALKAKGHRQWLIDDLMFADPDQSLRSTLTVAVLSGRLRAKGIREDPSQTLEKVGVLATTSMLKSLESLDFRKDSYTFPLVVQPLAGDLPGERLDPRGWFLSAND